MKVAIFSKHLQFLSVEDAAYAAKQMGFDGIDLAVRKGGHVEPERVRKELPAAVAGIRKRGLEVPMLTTDIVDAETPYAGEIFSLMKDLGIRLYRWGGFKWTDGPLPPQIAVFRSRAAKLAELNARFGVSAMYHTHSGSGLVGAAIWDLHEILTGLDPRLVGVNFDIGHATVEGGVAGWINSFRITGDYVRGIAVKDFRWEKDSDGKWQAAWRPLGQGMVRFAEFFGMLKQSQFSGPLQLHIEYPLGGVENGKREITMKREEIYAAMARDLMLLRGYLSAAQLQDR